MDILINSITPPFSSPREMIWGLGASRGANWRCFGGACFQSRATEDTFANQTLKAEPSWTLEISAHLGQSLPERLGKCLLRHSLHVQTTLCERFENFPTSKQKQFYGLHVITWDQLGQAWASLGPNWGQLGLTWGQLGANLGPIWVQFGANLEPTWANLGPTWANMD